MTSSKKKSSRLMRTPSISSKMSARSARDPAKVTDRVAIATREARRVRRFLVRWRRDTDLGGDCAIASLLVAAAIGDVTSLRHHDIRYKAWSPHVWNVVDGVIIDVTATQFNDLDEPQPYIPGELQPYVRGVLVTRHPHIYHGHLTGTGKETLAYLACVGHSWYDGDREREVFQRALRQLIKTT